MTDHTSKLAVGVHGATGRMGRALVQLLVDHPTLRLGSGLCRDDSPHRGKDLGTLVGLSPLGTCASSAYEDLASVDVVIDFSQPEGVSACVSHCVRYGKPMVIGTTALREDEQARIQQAATTIPIVVAPNTSVGIAVLTQLTQQLRTLLGDWDVGITDIHHKHKKDAPSGTARQLQAATGGACAVSSLRVGSVVGEHSVLFEHEGEQLMLTHKATDRSLFARGALVAAAWVHRQKSGLYGMKNVLWPQS